jgi:AraC family transcriptional regulator
MSGANAKRATPVWDGWRFVISESRAAWPSASLLVRNEDIRRSRSWKDVTANHTIIVNLGGLTRHFERTLEDGTRFSHQTTVGDMSVLPKNCGFAGHYDGDTIEYAIWEMSAPALRRLADEAGISGPVEFDPRLAHRDEFVFRSIARLAELAATAGNLSVAAGESISRAIGMHLIAAYCGKTVPLPARGILSPAAARALQDYVEEHLADKITLAELAAIAGVSVHNLLIGFRERFAMTPTQFVIQQRIRRSRWLLNHSSKAIAEIAYETGFSSQSHLTDLFRRHSGTTPAVFRASVQ